MSFLEAVLGSAFQKSQGLLFARLLQPHCFPLASSTLIDVGESSDLKSKKGGRGLSRMRESGEVTKSPGDFLLEPKEEALEQKGAGSRRRKHHS